MEGVKASSNGTGCAIGDHNLGNGKASLELVQEGYVFAECPLRTRLLLGFFNFEYFCAEDGFESLNVVGCAKPVFHDQTFLAKL